MSNQNEQTGRPAAPDRIIPPDGNAEDAGKESKVYPITAEVEELMNQFIEDEEINTNMTGRERMRLFGAGVRNFGFIEKAYDLGRENPDFLPTGFNIRMMYWNIKELEDARQSPGRGSPLPPALKLLPPPPPARGRGSRTHPERA